VQHGQARSGNGLWIPVPARGASVGGRASLAGREASAAHPLRAARRTQQLGQISRSRARRQLQAGSERAQKVGDAQQRAGRLGRERAQHVGWVGRVWARAGRLGPSQGGHAVQ